MHRSKKIRTVYIQHEMYSPVHYTYISYIFLVIFLLFKKWSTYCIRLDFENGCTLVIRMRCLFMITRFLSRRRSTCFTSRGLFPAASATTTSFKWRSFGKINKKNYIFMMVHWVVVLNCFFNFFYLCETKKGMAGRRLLFLAVLIVTL